jgi:hypothetical protein
MIAGTAALAVAGGGIVALADGGTSDPAPVRVHRSECDLHAAKANFAAKVDAARAGQTVCLAAGNYGRWQPRDLNKRITITPERGAIAGIRLDFKCGDQCSQWRGPSGITLDGMTIRGGDIWGDIWDYSAHPNQPRDLTFKNATFTGSLRIDGVVDADILIDHSTFNDMNLTPGAQSGRIQLPYSGEDPSGVTVQHSKFIGGNDDGIITGTGMTIQYNEFAEIRELGPDDPAHSDPIQCGAGCGGLVVRGNWVHDSVDGIVAYDGIHDALIEHNVISDMDSPPRCLELYGDSRGGGPSTVRHNTVVGCGIYLDKYGKSEPPEAGVGTVVIDNVTDWISTGNGAKWGRREHNLVASDALPGDLTGVPIFAGGSRPASFAGFALAPGSAGRKAASDGADVGARR